jgi:hypothetical protein
MSATQGLESTGCGKRVYADVRTHVDEHIPTRRQRLMSPTTWGS